MNIVHAKQALTEFGWKSDVLITIGGDGRIESVNTGAAAAGTLVDLALPAPANLHSHAFQRAMAGLTETRGKDPRDSFWTWRQLMYRFLDRLNPEQIEAITAQVFMEMLEAGYASAAEFHYLHHDVGGVPYSDIAETASRVVSAANATGIGLTLLPVLYTYGGCDGRALNGGQQRFGNDVDRFERLHNASRILVGHASADFEIGVAPHSLRAVDREGLELAARLGASGPIHMHLAEQVAEVEEVEAHFAARPVDWLLANAEVKENWCLIHCTQMTASETRSLAATGAVAGLCPITESSLGDGIFNGIEYTAAGGRLGVGSDSNIHIALFDELCTLEYSQRLRDRCRAAFASREQSTGRVLYQTAARGGAQAAGRNSGRIAPGAWADITGVATDNPWLCNRLGDAALDSLIFTGHGRSCISDVWSAGRHVVSEGRHVERDRIVRNFMNVMTTLGQDI